MSTLLIVYFCCALLLSTFLTRGVRDLAHKRGWLERPALDRHVHKIPLPRIGGVAIFLAFALVIGAALLAQKYWHLPINLPFIPTLALLGPAFLIFLLGLYDDLRGLSPSVKFFVQGVAATLLYLGGYGVHHFDLVLSGHVLRIFIGLPLTIFWVLMITNAFNLIDGLDGLAAGSALFSTIVIFALTLFSPSPMVALISVVLAGAILGFLRFNFHPASIFLGDSGSLFIGFIISALAIASSQKAPTIVAVSIPLLSLGFPILDVVLAVSRRFLRGAPLFLGDRDHIHHKLLKRGLSQREAVLLLYAVTAGFGFVSLVLLHRSAETAIILALTGTAVLVGVQQLRYDEFGAMLSLLERATHRRQIVANHVAVRRAAETLETCDAFPSICRLLQDTLQPVGFDGIQLQMLHPNGFPAESFRPLRYEPDGKLILFWSDQPLDDAPWELRLELVSANERWGYLSLFRAQHGRPITVDVNILASHFCGALSKAVKRACDHLGPTADPGMGGGTLHSRTHAAGSTTA